MKSFLCLSALLLSAVTSSAYELDVHARAIESPAPVYPASGPYEADDGIVSIVVQVDAAGGAKVSRVMCSTAGRFAEAARGAIERWKFSPAKREGRPSSDVLEFVFIFSAKKKVEIIGPLYES